MEPPIVPLYPRERLTRDFTRDYNDSTASGQPRSPRERTVVVPKQPISESSGSETSPPSTETDESSTVGTEWGRNKDDIPKMRFHELTTRLEKSPPEDLRRLDFSLEPIDESLNERSSFEPSRTSVSNYSDRTGLSSSDPTRLPDFFSPETFQIVLKNPTTSHQLLKFSQLHECGESLMFLEKVDKYHQLLNEVAKSMFAIHRDFISSSAISLVTLHSDIMKQLSKDLKVSLSTNLPKLESVFVDSQSEIEKRVAQDVYPRFVRHQMTMSASKALAANRNKYAGLGDAFVLTDPAKADNPIVFASDGFVSVTGYPRNEIIPRNCRFLQCRHTDKAAVTRLRNAISDRQESVELLLNEKKTGEPFWNLLYTTPLFDERGNVVFFLGGQVNCSTTIHNASDILRILSMSKDTDEEKDHLLISRPKPPPASKTSRLFSAFRSGSKSVVPLPEPGMEGPLLDKIEKLDLKKQMTSFYTAYSKFIIVNYSTFFISFHSAGIPNMLFATRKQSLPDHATVPGGSMVGMDIFKFLAAHTSDSLPREFKSRVKAALKVGQPISLDLTLCTRRYMGYEKFVTHWTPLKNEGSDVGFIVLTLGGGLD